MTFWRQGDHGAVVIPHLPALLTDGNANLFKQNTAVQQSLLFERYDADFLTVIPRKSP